MRKNLWNSALLCHGSVAFPLSEKLTDRLVNSPESQVKIKRYACTLQAISMQGHNPVSINLQSVSESQIHKKIPTDLDSLSIKHQPISMSCTGHDKTANALLGLLAHDRP
jgi:hypothetical protein